MKKKKKGNLKRGNGRKEDEGEQKRQFGVCVSGWWC